MAKNRQKCPKMLQSTVFFWKYKNMKKTSFFLQFLPTKNGIFWTKKSRFFFAPKLFTFCSKNNGFFFVRFPSIKWHFLSKKKHFFYGFLAYILEQFGAKISIKFWNNLKKKKKNFRQPNPQAQIWAWGFFSEN